MPETVQLAEYLFTRLKQLGVGSVHGVPGDYNLTLLDYVEPAGLHWVGNCNELNAGYATDGYARINGVGALITTFGVGELSAVNAIAGAYTELAKVVHIVGTPRRNQQETRALIHHTLLDGDYHHFARMYEHVTVAQTDLIDPRTAPEQIDTTILQCLIQSRPVYIQVPVDMVSAQVPAARLASPLTIPDVISSPDADAAFTAILEKIKASKRPMLYVDGESRALGMVDDIQKLVKETQWPTWTSVFGKDIVDETLPNACGMWQSNYSSREELAYINSADLVLCFGPHFSNTNTHLYTTIPPPEKSIFFKGTSVVIGDRIFRDLPAKAFLSALLSKLDLAALKQQVTPENTFKRPVAQSTALPSSSELTTQENFYRPWTEYLNTGDILLAETGTPSHGTRDITFRPHMRYFSAISWLSIGYMLPATQGAALAQRELYEAGKWHGSKPPRTILMIGDGSFQMTAQELSTIIKERLNVTIVLINNDGYTIERCIHGIDEGYNDVARWRYLGAPNFFGIGQQPNGGEYVAETAKVRTWGEMKTALEAFEKSEKPCLRMIEVIMEREDATKALKAMMDAQKLSSAKK
ncbi:Pyruvate decarboxylase [Pseudocercospora fuligena]|uniref:Pyruvate decarboxylase n=1 Tax=Pseudocercospora fuligena TaxID=685502 RepID=A0A8H6RBN6_9PEZI|nr:Pyruvate decarboxylase [Pseudocercospora fuligena]